MKPISDFLPRLAPYLTGCPVPLMQQALVDAAIAFCDASGAVRQRLDAQTQPSGWGDVELDLPRQQRVSRVLAVWADGIKLRPTSAEHAPDLIGTGRPTTYFTRRNDSEFQLLLSPTPDKAVRVTAEVALRPLHGATQLEDDLFDLWLPALLAGAKATLMAVPDQPFSNPAMAPVHAAEADRLATKARVDASYGRGRGEFRVQMRPFA